MSVHERGYNMQPKMTYVPKGNLEYTVNSFPGKNITKVSVLKCPTVQETCEKYCRKSVLPMIIYLCETEGEIDGIYPGIEGKARCMDKDEFKPEIGQKIAICKTEMKYFQKMNRMYQRFIKKLQLTINELENLIARNDQKIATSKQELAYLGGEPEKQVN